MWKGAKTGLQRGKNGVGMGIETGFKRHKNGISPDLRIWNGVEWPFFAVPHLYSLFFAVPPLFSPVFDDFRQEWEKTSSENGGTGRKEKRSF